MAKLKIVENTAKCERYGDLAPGKLFYACGDIAIKTTNEWAIVLKDGNYVHRNDDDFVEVVEYAELHVGKRANENPEPSWHTSASDEVCEFYDDASNWGGRYCLAEKGILTAVSCDGLCSYCENGRYKPSENQ